jgi:hypothetical protein
MGSRLYGPQRFEASPDGLHVTPTVAARTHSPGKEHQPGKYPGMHVEPVADSETFFQHHPKGSRPRLLESYSDGLLA